MITVVCKIYDCDLGIDVIKTRLFFFRKYLDCHLMTHISSPVMCICCDNNIDYVDDQKAHFELHCRISTPCRRENCWKRFIVPLDFMKRRNDLHQRHITNEEEKAFVRHCIKQRAVEEGLEYMNNKIAKRKVRRTSSESSVDMECYRTFTQLLKDMHDAGTHLNLTKV